MPYKYLPPLNTPNKTKIILLIIDGLGGLPMQAGGKTELETAHTPHMDQLAAQGALGRSTPIRIGITPGSGPAHLALFGSDPLENMIGRGALSAAGIDIPLIPGDVAARGNFCSLDQHGILTDRRAGRISSDAAAPLVARLNAIKIPGVSIEVRPIKEYRFVVVMRGSELSHHLADTDPQKIGVPPHEVRATDPSAGLAAKLFNQFVSAARTALADQPRANGITLRGFATDPGLPTYQESYGLRAACVAVYPMYKGVAKLVGMDVIPFDGESPGDEFTAVAQHWDAHDFFFVHIKKTDSMGEDGNFDGKVKVIEQVDQALPQLLALQPDVLMITGDHATPAKLRAHSWHPVPFLLHAPLTVMQDGQTIFGERACAQGGLGTFLAQDVMSLGLAHALRLGKYGA